MSRPKEHREPGREEMKYLVPAAWRERILELVSPHARPDPHARPLGGSPDRLGYTVHSLYFDTPQLTDYFQRLDRLKVRNRLRIRTYGRPGEGQPLFLENKRKSHRWVIKHRMAAGDADAWCCSAERRPWQALGEALDGRDRFAARSFDALVNGSRRNPVTTVHYQREVLVPRGPDPFRARLTLDHGVRASRAETIRDLFDPGDVPLIPESWLVMEIKYTRAAPTWLTALRRQLGVQAVAISKYALSVANTLRVDHPQELASLLPPQLCNRWRSA